jgi:hypothetical protein
MGNESHSKYEVFISYSSKDKKWADAACAVLEKHKIRCWIAPRDITPGTEWGASIISGMDGSKIMVLIFSTHANQSAQVRREVERAIGKGLIVLPFRIEDVSPEGAMEYALSNTHWLDGFTPPLERQFGLLARSCNALLGRDVGPMESPAEAKPAPTAPTAPADSAGPAAAAERLQPRTRWLIAIGASVYGLAALILIIVAVKWWWPTAPEPPKVADSPGPADRSRQLRSNRRGPSAGATPTSSSAGFTPIPASGRARLPIAALPQVRIPPAGPAHRAKFVVGALWTIEGDQLVKQGLGDGWVMFGDPDWTDYDLTFHALKSAGPLGIGCGFRHSESKVYLLGLGGPDGTHSISHWNSVTKSAALPHKSQGAIQWNRWYRVKISLRGQHIRIELDEQLLFDCEDDFNARGAVSLRCFNSGGRFRDIKVAAPDGTVLWEGPPDLPEPESTPALPAQAQPRVAARRPSPPQAQQRVALRQPSPPQAQPKVEVRQQPPPLAPPDPEKDPKLRATVKMEYQEGVKEIKKQALGMSTNRANEFRRREPTKLLNNLAKKHNLEVDQVKRMVGAR